MDEVTITAMNVSIYHQINPVTVDEHTVNTWNSEDSLWDIAEIVFEGFSEVTAPSVP